MALSSSEGGRGTCLDFRRVSTGMLNEAHSEGVPTLEGRDGPD